MSKIAVLTDSNSGITIEEGKRNGIHVIPMPFIINGEEYLEEISLSQKTYPEYKSPFILFNLILKKPV